MIVNYDESILSYIASIRKYYGLNSSFASNANFDNILAEKAPKQIFLILVDGMGANLLKKKLSPDAFLNRNMYFKAPTVYPPTTTAATTAILNGKAPNENAWVGWQQYVEEINDSIVPFRGKSFYEDIDYGSNYFNEIVPVTNIIDELNKKDYSATKLFPSFAKDGYESFTEMCCKLAEMSCEKTYDFVYAYFDRYDSLMHRHGPKSRWCDIYLQHINDCLEQLAEELDDDTMMIYLADHGQIDLKRIDNLYPKYSEYFYHKPGLEPRCMAFYVKDEYKDVFPRMFKEEYENEFILLTHDQVLQTGLFGPNKNHPRFEEFIGDFLALAKSDVCFEYTEKPGTHFKGQHAGILDDELLIPIGIYQK